MSKKKNLTEDVPSGTPKDINVEFDIGDEYVSEEDSAIEEDIVSGSRYEFPAILSVSAAPHIKSSNSVRSIMLDVVIALIPAYIWGILVFGTRALAIGVIAVASSVLFEFLYEKIMGKKITVSDGSAIVTGLLLGMNLSPAVPYWLPVIGSAFAMIIVKGIFGGLGKNIVNPALAARAFLFIAWPAHMVNNFCEAGMRLGLFDKIGSSADIVASATPLTQIKGGTAPTASMFDLIIGNTGGCIGEVSALFLIVGGIYLLVRRVITWQIPVSYIGTVALVALIFPRAGMAPGEAMLTEIFSGGLIICAIFMATDYVTSPVTPWGKIIFGIGCGVITVLIRYFGGYSEGASFSILIMNLLVWYIDKLTMPRPFGGKSNVK